MTHNNQNLYSTPQNIQFFLLSAIVGVNWVNKRLWWLFDCFTTQQRGMHLLRAFSSSRPLVQLLVVEYFLGVMRPLAPSAEGWKVVTPRQQSKAIRDRCKPGKFSSRKNSKIKKLKHNKQIKWFAFRKIGWKIMNDINKTPIN